MTSTNTSEPISRTKVINRVLYALMTCLGLYFLIRGEAGVGLSNLGIALVFDPFDQKITWAKRPLYQRVWLIVHLLVVLAALVMTIR